MKRNIHIKLILLLIALTFIMFISRIIFFFFNYNYFSDIALKELIPLFFYGIRFDLSAIFTLNLPVIVLLLLPFKFTYSKKYFVFSAVFFTAINSLALLFNTIDFVYFGFINTRTSAEIFRYLTISFDIIYVLPSFILDFWFVPLLVALMAWAFWKLFKTVIRDISYFGINKKNVLFRTLSVALWLGISVLLIRGGLQLRPLSVASAAHYTTAKYIPLLLNTPFNIIKTFNKDPIIIKKYFTSETELKKHFNPVVFNKESESFKPDNVVIFILEGFSKEHIGRLNPEIEKGNYKGYTPFLDSLIDYSLVFNNAYANGKRTIDAPPAILSSIPNLMNEAFVLSPYAQNSINSLASLLKTKGYVSYFFHGGTNGTMGFDNFAKLAGFDNYFGRTEYNNDADFDGKWGIFDEPFLQRMAHELDKSPQPFLATVFTLSSHHPYTIPEKYKIKFPKGKSEIHESIGYTDFALREFFETASQMNWFDNTLFIFTADHTTAPFYKEYMTKTGIYAVPIIFYKKNMNLIGTMTTVASHLDIMPTVLDYLNFDKPFKAFGKSLLDTVENHFSVIYSDGLYLFVNEKFCLTFDGNECLALYLLKDDKMLKNNAINTFDKNELLKIEQLLKAYIQTYQQCMKYNKMIVE